MLFFSSYLSSSLCQEKFGKRVLTDSVFFFLFETFVQFRNLAALDYLIIYYSIIKYIAMSDYGFSEIECKIITEQIKRRKAMREEFLKQRTNPFKHASEAGYVVSIIISAGSQII